MSHRIITTISDINPARFREESYVHTLSAFEVKGYLSCEGPVKVLLKLAKDAPGDGVDEILCLTSQETKQERLFAYQGENITMSAYDFFKNRIRAFCEENGINKPEIHHINYQISESGSIIGSMLSHFGPGDVVDIDMSGGPRDLAIHIILCLEALEYRNVRIDQIVYANLSKTPKEISHEEYVFRINDLLTAISDFTNHGKSDALTELFSETDDQQIRAFCELSKLFSDKLSLCRTVDITANVREIFDLLRTMSDQDQSTLYNDARHNREQVFYHLLPVLRENFVQEPSKQEAGLLDLMIIEWCVRHNMLQQALTLFRENVAEALTGSLHLIEPNERVRLLYKELKTANLIDSHMGIGEYCIGLLQRDLNPLAEDYFEYVGETKKIRKKEVTLAGLSVSPETAGARGINIHMSHKNLTAILVYLSYIQNIRNTILHANENFDGYLKDENQKSLQVLALNDLRLPLSDDAAAMKKAGLPTATSMENIKNTLKSANQVILQAYHEYMEDFHKAEKAYPKESTQEITVSFLGPRNEPCAIAGKWRCIKIVSAANQYAVGDKASVKIIKHDQSYIAARVVK